MAKRFHVCSSEEGSEVISQMQVQSEWDVAVCAALIRRCRRLDSGSGRWFGFKGDQVKRSGSSKDCFYDCKF